MLKSPLNVYKKPNKFTINKLVARKLVYEYVMFLLYYGTITRFHNHLLIGFVHKEREGWS